MGERGDIPDRERLAAGDEELAFGGHIRHNPAVEAADEFMYAADQALDEKEHHELNTLIEGYGRTLDLLRQEQDPVQVEVLRTQLNELRDRLEGERKFSLQVTDELEAATGRADNLEQDLVTSKRVASLEGQHQPENPDTDQAKLAEGLYRDMMFSMDQLVDVDRLITTLKDDGVEIAKLTVEIDEPQKAGGSDENVEARYARLRDERRGVVGEMSQYQDFFKHPEQFDTATLEAWQSRIWNVFESLLLLKRQLQAEQSKFIKWRDTTAPSTDK